MKKFLVVITACIMIFGSSFAKKQTKAPRRGLIDIELGISKEQVKTQLKAIYPQSKIVSETPRTLSVVGIKIGLAEPDSVIFGFSGTGRYKSSAIIMESVPAMNQLFVVYNYLSSVLDTKYGTHQVGKINFKPPYTPADTGIFGLDALKDGKLDYHTAWILERRKNGVLDSQDKIILLEITEFCRIKYSLQTKD